MLFLFSIVWHLIMARLTPKQRLQIVQLYYENSRVMNMFRAPRLWLNYGQNNRPIERTICNANTRLETQHSLLDNIRPNRPRPARSKENIVAVAGSVHEDRGESIRRRAQQFGLTHGTTWCILRRYLKLKAYKKQFAARPSQATSLYGLWKSSKKIRGFRTKFCSAMRPLCGSMDFKIKTKRLRRQHIIYINFENRDNNSTKTKSILYYIMRIKD
nr:uncharacterized protein LOC118683835 [Bactrocera oleae]